MSEITIAGAHYRTGKLNPLVQLHIARRLAPVFAAMGLRAQDLKLQEGTSLGDFLEPIAAIAAKMPDEDVDYIIYACLNVVSRRQDGDRYQQVLLYGSKKMQFEDIDLPVMMRLAAAVVQENLGGFFALLPGRSG
jgi:hypothetical protein